MAGSGRARSEWNATLLSDALAPLYAGVLAAVAAEAAGRPGPGYWKLWPAVNLPMPWAILSKAMYKEVRRASNTNDTPICAEPLDHLFAPYNMTPGNACVA